MKWSRLFRKLVIVSITNGCEPWENYTEIANGHFFYLVEYRGMPFVSRNEGVNIFHSRGIIFLVSSVRSAPSIRNLFVPIPRQIDSRIVCSGFKVCLHADYAAAVKFCLLGQVHRSTFVSVRRYKSKFLNRSERVYFKFTLVCFLSWADSMYVEDFRNFVRSGRDIM